MRLTRVFVAGDLSEGGSVDLPPETASHVSRVLRARAGEALVLFNGDGREFAAEIRSVRGVRVNVTVGRAVYADRESPLAVTLLQCVPRGDRMDFIVQKATELGVQRIVPLLSQRSVVRLDETQAGSRAAHWHAIAVSACEQCGRTRLPIIEVPRHLIACLGDAAPAAGLRIVLEPDTAPRQAPAPQPAGAVEVAVGPEGGFSGDELEAFRLSGFQRLALGPRILRTETAAIAALCWLQARFGDLGAG